MNIGFSTVFSYKLHVFLSLLIFTIGFVTPPVCVRSYLWAEEEMAACLNSYRVVYKTDIFFNVHYQGSITLHNMQGIYSYPSGTGLFHITL